MSLINIIDMVRRFHWRSVAWPWNFDPFVELALKPRTEIAISKDGISLYRKSWLQQALPRHPLNLSLESVCDSAKSGEAVVLSISEEMCFVLHLEVPTLAMGKIASILDFELTKTTPFSKEQVYAGWMDQNSKSNPSIKNITYYVMRRDFFNECINALSSKGARVQAVVVRLRDGNCVPFALSVSGKDFAGIRAQFWTKAAIISGGAMALVAILFIGEVLFSQSKTSNFIEASTESFAIDAEVVRKQLEIMKTSHSELSALITKSSASSKKSLVIEEISKILTDDSYLDGLSISGNTVIIDGVAANPEGLIALLEASPIFNGVTFNMPSFRNPGEVNSRFSIKLNIESIGA